ncbi:MAG TPA: DNA methyltransferase [Caulobacteraceae bacterium]|nr:DNA methyltransferase [Caulobacteraceae bacterium]
MNAVEIEEAVSKLAAESFDAAEFPFAFLAAFGNRDTTLKRLRSGASYASDVPGAVLQRSNIHLATCEPGTVRETLARLRDSPRTAQAKAKFVAATDGCGFEAENLETGDTVACAYADFADHFGFFLPLAGISTVRQIAESAFDIRAVGRLNKLYIELLKQNPDWGAADRRHDMNHFMARLIFCFFAEDTDIFGRRRLFTDTVEQMSERDGSNTHAVIEAIFRAMNTRTVERTDTARWADAFPYVNGGLFSGSPEAPRFSRIARAYLAHIGALDWTKINPDIFGSMIQAVTEDEERGALGMHYTSVPNILKVLNPLFLDDLRQQLAAAGDNARALLNLRKRISRIRVFDPACGSGNFLVIAYKELRKIEAEINRRRGEQNERSVIPLTNFRGIELRDFPCEIARLALIIAEFQCDALYRGQQEALAAFLPLNAENWITCGNALGLDWLTVCPPTGMGTKVQGDDLFRTPLDQPEIDFENTGGETYLCGNPPYRGSQWQTDEQKADLRAAFKGENVSAGSLDYVAGWFIKARQYLARESGRFAFVATNSLNQGRHVANLWPSILRDGSEISFAYRSIKWSNLAANKAGVTVNIVGVRMCSRQPKYLYDDDVRREVESISPYLVGGAVSIVQPQSLPLSGIAQMSFGSMPNEGGALLLDQDEACTAIREHGVPPAFIRRFLGSHEFVQGAERRCIWVNEDDAEEARANAWLSGRFERVRSLRAASDRPSTNRLASLPFRFGEVRQRGDEQSTIVPRVSSEARPYLPVGLAEAGVIVGDRNFAMCDAPLWNMALIASRLHWVWIGTVCVRLEMRFSYSNTLGWNTFPVPPLTGRNKIDLTRCAEDILLAREAHFPATIADLYDPEAMPDDLRSAHERNDETLERIYIGRRFRNDTERLEKLFELYAKMTASERSATRPKGRKQAVPA